MPEPIELGEPLEVRATIENNHNAHPMADIAWRKIGHNFVFLGKAAGLFLAGTLVYQAGFDQGQRAPQITDSTLPPQVPFAPQCTTPDKSFIPTPEAEAYDAVAHSKYALTAEQRTIVEHRLDEAQTIGDVQQVMEDILSPYKINVIFGQLPASATSARPGKPAEFTHDSSKYDLGLAKTSTKHMLPILERLPDTVMKGLGSRNLYLTAGMTQNGQQLTAINYLDTDGTKAMLLGIGENESTAEGFLHNIAGLLYDQICPDVPFENDLTFMRLNYEDFAYTDDSYRQQQELLNHSVVSSEAATSLAQDEVATIKYLLNNGFDKGYDPKMIGPPDYKKLELVASRLVYRYPELAAILSVDHNFTLDDPVATATNWLQMHSAKDSANRPN